MRTSTIPSVVRHSHLIAAALFVGALLLYLSTLTRVHTFDALSYVTSVERKPWTELFHPHHLAYGPLGALMLTLGRALGYDGGAALPMQLVNVFAGALGVALFYATTRAATGRTDAALPAALLLGGSYAFWYYAVEIEVYTVATLFLIICLALIIQPHPLTVRRCLALGMAQGSAVLFHQTNVLFCIPVAVTALADLRATKDGRAFIGRWATYAVALTLVTVLPYLYVMLIVSHFRAIDAMLAWLTEYARTGWWGRPLTTDTVVSLATGLSDTLAQPGGGWFSLALGGTAAWAVGQRFREDTSSAARPEAPTPATILRTALIAWLATYGTFFAWWEPDNIEFWIAGLPPACLLFAQALKQARRWSAPIQVSLAIVGIMVWVNYGSITQRGNPTTDLQRLIARELAAHSTPSDLLIVPDGLQELYLPYYEQRENFISLNQALFDSAGSWEAACSVLRNRIATAQYAGAAIIIADEALHPPPRVLERHRITRRQVEECFAPYRKTLIRLDFADPIPGYWRLPTATELALTTGWTFERDTLGWQAFNVTGESVDGGWNMTPGIDPALLSPLLHLDARQVIAIEIRLANGTRNRDAQLFYAGPDGVLSEERSVRWELNTTGDATTYTIDLRSAPGWDGIITRLRIDPVGIGDGGSIRIEWVRLHLETDG